MIDFRDFQKVELRIATILTAERVEGSNKLLKLQVETGDEKRQIVAGIGKKYEPEDLIDTQIVIVANLAPREMMGLESQGMLLAVKNPDGPILLRPENTVASGTTIC